MGFNRSSFAAAGLAAFFMFAGSSEAATLVGDKCGNKWIALSQDGHELDPAICSDENSTGSGSPIAAAGWSNGGESEGGTTTNSLFEFMVNTSTGAWSIVNKLGYTMLGISIKQGDGFAFYVLDLTKALNGFYYTGNNSSPTGHGLSHANVWYKGRVPPPPPPPPGEVPLPAAAWLMLAGLGGLGALKLRKKA